MFKLKFVILLNLIELDHRQTTPKILNQPGKQEEATGINGESTGNTATRTKVEKTKEQSQHNKGHKMSENSKIQHKYKTELKITKL